MRDIRTKYKHGVTLVGGGPVPEPPLIACRSHAPTLVAADGGADQVRAHGLWPDLILGDLDSLVNQQTWRDSGIQIIEFVEQETTDFEKCLSAVAAEFYLCLGFLGGRLDHQLAALSALIAFRDKRIVLISDSDLCFHCPPDLSLTLPVGTRVSLMPMRPVTGIRSEGLEWDVAGLRMEPGGRIGTSNRTAGPVRLAVDGHGLLVILPVSTLDTVMAQVIDPT